MTGRREFPADVSILGLLTASEAALQLSRPPGRRCSVERVARLAGEGELTRVWLGGLARYTPESVAAYRQRLTAAAGASGRAS